MTPLPDTITITSTPEDARKSGHYVNPWNCLLATAVKRQLRAKTASCDSDSIDIEKQRYQQRYRLLDGGKVYRHYNGTGSDCDARPTVKRPFKVTPKKV